MSAYARIALITGANQGIGLQVARELAAAGVAVVIGSRDMRRGAVAARDIGPLATAVQLDVTDAASVAAAAASIERDFGRLDVLVNNAGISRIAPNDLSLKDMAGASGASRVPIDEVRAIWETNVFGVLRVYQAMLPLLRRSADARIVNVSSVLGSMTVNADPAYPFRFFYSPGYSASKTALNALSLSMMVELEPENIKVNLVSPGFTSTALNNYEGAATVEDGAREVVRVALLGPDAPGGTFTRAEGVAIPW